jgi:hypothetical protein
MNELMNEKQETSWLKHPGEGTKAHEAATAYFYLGPARSQVAVAKALGKGSKLLEKWSSKYKWVERANAYDAWREEKCLEGARRLAEQNAEKQAQRAEEEREDMHLIRKLARDRIKTVLKLPVVKSTTTTNVDSAGRPTEITVLKPIGCSLDSAAHLIQVLYATGNKDVVGAAVQQQEVFDDVPLTPRGK